MRKRDLVLAILAGVVGGFLAGRIGRPALAADPPGALRVSSLDLVAKGKVRAKLSTGANGGPRMVFLDEKGHPRVLLGQFGTVWAAEAKTDPYRAALVQYAMMKAIERLRVDRALDELKGGKAAVDKWIPAMKAFASGSKLLVLEMKRQGIPVPGDAAFGAQVKAIRARAAEAERLLEKRLGKERLEGIKAAAWK